MFSYYLQLGLRSLRRNPALTALMVMAIGFGVAASMTTYSVFRATARDPIPQKSSVLFNTQVDAFGPENIEKGEPPQALTYKDATALFRAHKAKRQTIIYPVSVSIIPDDPARLPELVKEPTPRTRTSSRCSTCPSSRAAAGRRKTTRSTPVSPSSRSPRTTSSSMAPRAWVGRSTWTVACSASPASSRIGRPSPCSSMYPTRVVSTKALRSISRSTARSTCRWAPTATTVASPNRPRAGPITCRRNASGCRCGASCPRRPMSMPIATYVRVMPPSSSGRVGFVGRRT